MMNITVACLDMAGTTVADDGSVMAAFGAAAAEFGIVLLDLSLIDAQGLDTVRRLREQHPRVPIIVVSGLDDEEVAAALRAGDYELAVETPSDCSILATMPVVGSKNFVLTVVHPPTLLMVNSVLGLGKLNLAATDGSTGR